VLIALGVMVIDLYLCYEGLQALTSGGWQTTYAIVIDADTSIQRARSRNYIDVTYQYVIDGHRHTGERVCFFEDFFGCRLPDLEQTLRDYPVGTTLPIYYAPIFPELSVIYRDGAVLLFIIAMPIVLIGSLIAILPGYLIIKPYIRLNHLNLETERKTRR
jgi:hypothetical protein